MSQTRRLASGALAATLLCALRGSAVASPDAHARVHEPDQPSHASRHGRVDAHAPIGVMVDHAHAVGEVMLSYRFMRMAMDGNRDERRRVSREAVLRDFPVAPTQMDMEMHMLGVMWAPHERVTLAGMLPLLRLDMKHRTRSGRSFTTRSHGIGDVSVTGLIRLLDTPVHHVHLGAGLSLPTGSVSEKDDTPAGRVRLPYPMQLGSGSYDLLPSLTYRGLAEGWSWGGQLRATYRTGINNRGYRWGHRWGASVWLARTWLPWLSTSLRLDYGQWNDIRGEDDELVPAQVPTADPDRRAGRRLDLLLGANLLVTSGPLHGHRFALEVGRPAYQDLDGPQLEADWLLTAGWQYAF